MQSHVVNVSFPGVDSEALMLALAIGDRDLQRSSLHIVRPFAEPCAKIDGPD